MHRTLFVFALMLLTTLATTPPPLSAQRVSCSVGGRQKQCQVPPRAVDLIPTDSVGGDMEFAGHPIDVTLSASRRLSADSTALVVDLAMQAVEVVRDSTWIEGTDSVVLYTAERGWKIESLPELPLVAVDELGLILTGKAPLVVDPPRVVVDRTAGGGTCERHAADVCRNTTDNGVVARWTVWGDSKTRDLGQTRVSIHLASLSLNVTKVPAAVVSERERR
jgi:hypothetical protein